MSKHVFSSILALSLVAAGTANAQIAPTTDDFRAEVACDRYIELLEYEVEWFGGVEQDVASFDPANRPVMCEWLRANPAPDRAALCAGPPPDDFWPEFLTDEQVSFLIQISVAKSNLDWFANGLPFGMSVDLQYVRTYCSPSTEQHALRLMRTINGFQHPGCLDACGNAITLPGISHSADSCPDL